ncbi:extracellular solute-binding protein [Lipingzhangella sp. LS1_29]|uniref:Extracellular solute-binding protein n=1 Tax=Lipingzhangella rawalii TaxID=2055835 RepID=A0ABU2H0L0_9ACTN|nr:extracellular solute-binding protein [Lipingzhangella rawalii]MDS1268846.1 extracellular solute-binding protein [Lipingzhangella rawalii]
MRQHFPQHRVVAAASAGALLMATACGQSGPGADDTLQVWAVEDEVLNPLLEESIADFNAGSDVELELVTIQNDPYKERLQVAMGSPERPDIFFNWGGGNLGQYVDAGQVYDMTADLDDNPEFRDAFLPSVLEVAELDGSVYGVPMQGTQPVSFFYNQEVFDEAGAEPPETYAELLDLVEVFQGEEVTPVVLPGAASWTLLMWVSYLVDRVGGAEVYADISRGADGAWDDPAVIEALERSQDLVDEGAFGSDFAAVDWDGGQATTLLAEGEAAMILMGPWMVQDVEANAPEFYESGDLGWFAFPEVESGQGDPSAVVGPPTNYFSVHAETDHPEVAMDWLIDSMASDEYVQGLIDSGAVPPIEGIEDDLADSERAEFTTWLYDLTEESEHFTPAWDQDLDPSEAETMLTNFSLVFEGDMTPEEFVADMDDES